jgi:hypothetical protein
MNKVPPFFHYFLGIIFAGSILIILKYDVQYPVFRYLGVGFVCLILGIWGNLTKLVFFRIPWGERSYKIINFILIFAGIAFLTYGGYLYVLLTL